MNEQLRLPDEEILKMHIERWISASKPEEHCSNDALNALLTELDPKGDTHKKVRLFLQKRNANPIMVDLLPFYSHEMA